MDTVTRKQHLTDGEFSDLLAGDMPNAGVEAHLAACEHCRSELDTVQASLGGFRQVSTEWARVAAPARVPIPSAWSRYLGATPSWAAGLTAAAMTALLSFSLGFPSAQAPSQAHVAPAPIPSTNELADDNRLMLSINQELSYRAQPAVPSVEVHTEARRDSHRPDQTELD